MMRTKPKIPSPIRQKMLRPPPPSITRPRPVVLSKIVIAGFSSGNHRPPLLAGLVAWEWQARVGRTLLSDAFDFDLGFVVGWYQGSFRQATSFCRTSVSDHTSRAESQGTSMASSIHAQDPHSHAPAPVCREAAGR